MPAAHTLHRRQEPASAVERSAAFDAGGAAATAFGPPMPYDAPIRFERSKEVSPVTNAKLLNEQEMQSGADAMAGVHDSKRSGQDYSREQGVGRAPGWQWPFKFFSGAYNFNSLDKWNPERQALAEEPPGSGINPYYGVPEPPYSPIAAMDQYTMFYENDPGQRYEWPEPVSIPEVHAPSLTELAVLPL